MTITDKQALEWALEESKRKGPSHRSDEDRTRDFEAAVAAFERPALLTELKPARLDRLFWNVAWMLMETARRDTYEAQRLRLVRAVPGFVERLYSGTDSHNEALEMFWDVAIDRASNADRLLVDAIFDALKRQLEIPNIWCQQSALHGFNHLREPRCRPIIARFIETCANANLREYARGAMTFTLM